MEATTSYVQAPTWTSEDNSPPEHLPTHLEYKWLNKHSTLQINQFLPFFLCSVNLVLCTLLCNSTLPLSVQQVCSASTRALILLFFNSLLLCSAFHLTLHICSISSCASSSSLFLLFHYFTLTERPTWHSTFSSSFIHMNTMVQLPNSLCKMSANV